MATPSVLEPVRGTFRAILRTVVPSAVELDPSGWASVEEIVELALADRPPKVRKQLALFLRVIGLLALVRYRRRLERLSSEQARSFMAALERAPIPILRKGLWGVRTLAYMGYYARKDAQLAIGYRPALRGWEARGANEGPWNDRAAASGPEPAVRDMLEGDFECD